MSRRWVLWAFVGLRWPSVGCCGPALAFVGRRWVLWAFVGLRWPSSGAVGLRGPALTCIGRRWALWACIGLPCAAVDLCWPSLAVVGCCGPSLGAVGLRRPALAFRGLSWLSSKPKRGVVGLVQPASDKDLIKWPPQLAVHAMGWACSCIKLSSSSVRKTIKK